MIKSINLKQWDESNKNLYYYLFVKYLKVEFLVFALQFIDSIVP